VDLQSAPHNSGFAIRFQFIDVAAPNKVVGLRGVHFFYKHAISAWQVGQASGIGVHHGWCGFAIRTSLSRICNPVSIHQRLYFEKFYVDWKRYFTLISIRFKLLQYSLNDFNISETLCI
jgi:hypothetical protein